MRRKNENEHFLSVKDVSVYLGVSKRTVLNYIKNENLNATRYSKHGPYRIATKDLETWLESHTIEGNEQNDETSV